MSPSVSFYVSPEILGGVLPSPATGVRHFAAYNPVSPEVASFRCWRKSGISCDRTPSLGGKKTVMFIRSADLFAPRREQPIQEYLKEFSSRMKRLFAVAIDSGLGPCPERRRTGAIRSRPARTRPQPSRRTRQDCRHRFPGRRSPNQRGPAQLRRSAEEVRSQAPAAQDSERRRSTA